MKREITSRRAFLAKSILASGGIILSSQLLACKDDDFPLLGGGGKDDIPRFLHGVGSFDPTDSAVIIWTRFTPTETEIHKEIRVKWQVATDFGFHRIAAEGVTVGSAANDFTIIEDVTGLAAESNYFLSVRSRRT